MDTSLQDSSGWAGEAKGPRIAIVTAERAWPIRTGGQARVAGMTNALAHRWPVTVIGPVASGPRHIGVDFVEAPFKRRLRDYFSAKPRLGLAAFGSKRRLVDSALRRGKYDVVLFTHSYLAATVKWPTNAFTIVDFPNIEITRNLSTAATRSGIRRISSTLESVKARRWERRAAARADLVTTVDHVDASEISSWNSNTVVIDVANAAHASGLPAHSPVGGYALYACSADYPPNARAGAFLLKDVWPRVRKQLGSDARLVVVGRATDSAFAWAHGEAGVEVCGAVPDLGPYFAGAAVALAPVNDGGGTQLKVVEALANGRAIVATPFSARSVPASLQFACDIRDGADNFAEGIAELLVSVSARHRLETALMAAPELLTWGHSCEPLLEFLSRRFDDPTASAGPSA